MTDININYHSKVNIITTFIPFFKKLAVRNNRTSVYLSHDFKTNKINSSNTHPFLKVKVSK